MIPLSFYVFPNILKTARTTDSTDHRSDYRGRVYSQSGGRSRRARSKTGHGQVADGPIGLIFGRDRIMRPLPNWEEPTKGILIPGYPG